MTHTYNALLDYPAFEGRVVTERHARICRERGHAVCTQEGVMALHCPRCGDEHPRTLMEALARPRQYDRDCVELSTRVANEFEYIKMFGTGQTQVRINQADKRCKRYLR